jgi:hypothetical protein
MSTMTNFRGRLREPSLAEIITIETRKINAQLGRDSLDAARLIERMHVAASYVSQLLGGRALESIPISEVTDLDCDAVAENVASDAGQEATAGATRIVHNLVQHAHKFLLEMDSAAWETPSPLTRDLTDFIRGSLFEKLPIRGRIKLDLTIQPASVATES